MKEIMTTKEVCDFLKISRLTLYIYIKTKGLPACKIGRGWRFEKTAIEKWLEGEMKK